MNLAKVQAMTTFAVPALVIVIGLAFIFEDPPAQSTRVGTMIVFVGAAGFAFGTWLWLKPSPEQ